MCLADRERTHTQSGRKVRGAPVRGVKRRVCTCRTTSHHARTHARIGREGMRHMRERMRTELDRRSRVAAILCAFAYYAAHTPPPLPYTWVRLCYGIQTLGMWVCLSCSLPISLYTPSLSFSLSLLYYSHHSRRRILRPFIAFSLACHIEWPPPGGF